MDGITHAGAIAAHLILNFKKFGAQVWAQVGDQVWDQVNRAGYGLHDANWLGFAEFFKNEVGIKECAKLEPLIDLSKDCGWWWPFEGLVIFTEKPCAIFRNDQNRLHKDGALALAYPDGWGIYALNGVRMKPEHVLTESEKLDPKMILAESNVEIRRELIRKIGMERFLQVMKHKVLDEKKMHELNTEYSLLSVKVHDDLEPQAFLKMLNPSIGVWHVEGVPDECKTVMEALHSRKPPVLRSIPISEEGEEWYQQGDVAIWPRNAKSVRAMPSVLT